LIEIQKVSYVSLYFGLFSSRDEDLESLFVGKVVREKHAWRRDDFEAGQFL